MTILKLANKIRTYTKQTSTSLTDANLLLLINPAKDELSELVASRDIKGNYFILPATNNLTADQREYAFPDDILDHIFSVEASFTTATPLDYKLCLPDDFRRHGIGKTETNITSRYSNAKPRYEIQRKAVYLLSGTIIAVTSGLRLKYRVYPTDWSALTDDTTDISIDPTTTSFGFPRSLHELLARRCSIEWKGAHPGAVPLSPLELKYETDLERTLQGLEENDFSGETLATLPQYTDGNDGYSL